MDEWNEEFLAVEVEREIEKHRAERESLTTGATATGKKSKLGCVSILLYFILGLVLFQIVGGLLSAFSK
jgi:hypothetical protein